ncbi:Protein of unknown function DUF423, partial [Dillenia turbinata]
TDSHIWHKIAAFSGIAAIGLGAYGTHVFKSQDPKYAEVWHTTQLYHLVHTAALVAAPGVNHPYVFGGLLTAGILAFSGTCYVVAYMEVLHLWLLGEPCSSRTLSSTDNKYTR